MNGTDEKAGNAKERKPRIIRNRDIIKLSNVLYAIQDLCSTEQKRMWQQDRLWNMTQRITGLPGSEGLPRGLDASFAVIGEIEAKYEQECAAYTAELQEAEDILNAIPDRKLRSFVTIKYLLDLPDQEIMRRLCMRRRKYETLLSRIEHAPDMASVKWDDLYILVYGAKWQELQAALQKH